MITQIFLTLVFVWWLLYYYIIWIYIVLWSVTEETPTREELWREYLTNWSRDGWFLIINNNIADASAAAVVVVVRLSREDGRKRYFVFQHYGFCLIVIYFVITIVFRTSFSTPNFHLHNIIKRFCISIDEYRIYGGLPCDKRRMIINYNLIYEDKLPFIYYVRVNITISILIGLINCLVICEFYPFDIVQWKHFSS